MHGTNDELSVVVFKMLAGGLSLAITIPSLLSGSYHIFMLTTFVFLFGKLVDSLDSFFRAWRREMCIIYVTGCVLGILSLLFCLYYLGAVFDGALAGGTSDLSRYPLLHGITLWLIPFLVSAFYVITDLYHLGCVFYKYYSTKKHTIKYPDI